MKKVWKSLTGLSLAFVLSHSLAPSAGAQDLQWRPAGPKASAPVTQTGYTGVNPLGQPTAVGAPSVVRAKTDVEPPNPLATPTPGKTPSPVVIISDDPKLMPKAENGEFIPKQPTLVTPGGNPFVISSDGCGMSGSCGDCCGDGACWGSRLWGANGLLGWKRWFSHDDCCDTGCRTNCDPCGSCGDGCCGPRPKWWIGASYLSWGVERQDIPTLLSLVNPPGAVPQAMTIFDGDTLSNDLRHGGRFNFGFWLPNNDNWGFETTFFFLGKRSDQFVASGNGSANSPTLVRPITNAQTGETNLLVVSAPGMAGSFTVNTMSRIWGIDADVRRKLWCGPNSWLDLLVGYKHFYLEEGIGITDIETPLSEGGIPIVNFNVSERFRTINEFNGFQIGLQGEHKFGPHWFMQGTLKVALGNIHQTVQIDGTTTVSIPGGPSFAAPGGILALPTNIGRFTRDTFCVIPEAGLKVGYDINEHWRVWVGYDFLWANSVVRPGSQIDTVVNRTQIPFSGTSLTGPSRPAVLFQSNNFWTQGVSAGVEYRW